MQTKAELPFHYYLETYKYESTTDGHYLLSFDLDFPVVIDDQQASKYIL